MSSLTRKERGYQAEWLVARSYVSKWYEILDTNYTIVWWELDIVARDDDTIVFIEVKVIDAMRDDVIDYVTPSKLRFLRKTIAQYMRSHSFYDMYDKRVDVVFVLDNRIHDVYEWVIL